ncbi:unnamed protein product [Blepharisma stoltei]|uniref:AAA+ ATPase domain-containing protein n=1 Tax=Blepharisma stoltei TaxID=1481888 RepID=A0AAU9J0I4_9CILI|nr:unnamed protein product [Blepharisma stoltei]
MSEDLKKRLAKRLIATEIGLKFHQKIPRNPSTERLRPLPTLVPKLNLQETRSVSQMKKREKLEPIPSILRNNLSSPLKTDRTGMERSQTPFLDTIKAQEEIGHSRMRSTSRNPRSIKKHLHGDLHFLKTEMKNLSNMPTPLEFLQLIKHSQELRDDFWYCNRGQDAYDLEFVSFNERNQNEYFTISSRGITHFSHGDISFLTLEEWEREYLMYQKLKKIAFFKQYKLWKDFSLWKNMRRRIMMRERAQFLEQELFILDNKLRESFFEVRYQCYRISKFDMIDLRFDLVRSIKEFVEDQEIRRERRRMELEDIEKNIKENVRESCKNSMESFRKANNTNVLHDDLEEEEAFLIGNMYNKPMPYTHEAIIRTHLRRLAKFVKLCDYNIIDSKIKLCIATSTKMVGTITFDYTNRERGLNKQYQPIIIIEAELYKNEITFSPNIEELRNAISDVIIKSIELVSNNKNLSHSKEFDNLRRAMNEFADDFYDDNVDLMQMILDNNNILMLETKIREGLDSRFENVVRASDYLKGNIKEYIDNQHLKINKFKTVEIEVLSNTIKRYKKQAEVFKNLVDLKDVGIFRLDASKIKKIIIPSPIECISKLERLLPDLAYERSQNLYQEVSGVNKKLGNNPHDIHQYIQQVLILRDIEEKSQSLGLKINELKEMMGLMETYNIPAGDNTKDKYNDAMKAIEIMRQRTNLAYMKSEGNKIKFTKELKTHIATVDKRAQVLQAQLKDPAISDKNSSPILVSDLLKRVGKDVEELYTDANNYSMYLDVLELERKNFNHVINLRQDYILKNDMWSALNDWTGKLGMWKETPFKSIDVETIGEEVEGFYKVSLRSRQLEEQGNFVGQWLKQLVEELRDTMPVVIDLRCPALKERHWKALREILKQDINIEDTNFTLSTLLSMRVNDKKEEICEIALKARKEEELEKQLREILRPWETIEFQFKYLRDKDFYIFTAIEDISSLLEDTQVVITTILTNRYIGSLFDEVDKWNKKFSLFAATLDEWLTCQKHWGELEKIFSSQDIARQMHDKTKKFNQVNVQFKELMKSTYQYPLALQAATIEGTLQKLQAWNKTLEVLQRDLEEYLDKKRRIFSRFFFISNEELITILSNSQNPGIIQLSLRNMFDGIYSLQFSQSNPDDIEAMKSGEGEVIFLPRNTKIKSRVEDWLENLEKAMKISIKSEIREALRSYSPVRRKDWILRTPTQIVCVVDMIIWCSNTQDAISHSHHAVREHYDAMMAQLMELIRIVSTDLTLLQRRTTVALITQTVHNRDIVESIKEEDELISIHDFKWLQQLRYNWDIDSEDTTIKQVNASFLYGYEYLGAYSRLVITPLTDRCWITITSALHIKMGAAPAGPAGTGKTESTKDLAKALGRYCVVFNCSEQVTFLMTQKLFMGLCYTGSWTCLDEFNRIDIEVLSVIASQLRSIKHAKLENKSDFLFEEYNIPLVQSMGVFITMNPDYVGRTELPDNLKVLFRPVSMMLPDYTLIAEIMLFAEGFSNAKELSGKMTKLYKLSSEQLSQQDHYDFGMRAVKSVLNMAGQLKRKEPKLDESVVLIRAMRDSNVPKFLKDDLDLFDAIVQDLFPGIAIPKLQYGLLEQSIHECIQEQGLQPVPTFIEKVIQLYETISVRFGAMLVGPAISGKTECYKTLANAITNLRIKHNSDQEEYQKVSYTVINPKALSMGELFGEYNDATQDWKDGVGSHIMREYSKREDTNYQWIIFDGPVDSLWIENMNTVLDDNMMLCLGNGERMKLRKEMRVLFEVLDLASASPATVSRCGMVYMNIEAVGWKPYVKSWLKTLENWNTEQIDHIDYLISLYVDKSLKYIRRNLNEYINTMDSSLVVNLCSLVKALVPANCPRLNDEFPSFKKFIEKVFVFCVTWSLGGALDGRSASRFDQVMSSEIGSDLPKGSLYDSFVDPSKRGGEYKTWDSIRPQFVYNPNVPFNEIFVPTVDTVKYEYLLKLNIISQKPMFLLGPTGVGKSVLVKNTINILQEKMSLHPIFLTFSAQTNVQITQNSIVSKLDQKRKDLLGGPGINKVVIMIDDVNMPNIEEFGAQPPIELIRQLIDGGYFYERSKYYQLRVIDTTVICCAAPPEGGRHPLSPRFTRHFHLISIPQTSEDNLQYIFKSILEGFFAHGFKTEIIALTNAIVVSTTTIYQSISKELLPTPSKSHYIFNMRDAAKVFQGLMQIKPKTIKNQDTMINLWVHETSRVFSDRLVTIEDKNWLKESIVKMLIQCFRKNISLDELDEVSPKLFGDFYRGDLDMNEREYEEFPNTQILNKKVHEFLVNYNLNKSNSLDIVMFQEALEQLLRICRVLRMSRGNMMLVGLSGSGKQSLTKLAAYICHCTVFQIHITKVYKLSLFREDLKKLFIQAGGAKPTPTVFILNDNQIVSESFLEDINNLLNSGEIPNLFTKEELDVVEQDIRYIVEKNKMHVENIYNFFIQRVRENLHVVLCMSPVGQTFRLRMRMFPSLVNCCTISWFPPWGEDALLNVSLSRMYDLQISESDHNEAVRLKNALARACVFVHSSVESVADEFYQTLSRHVYVTPKSYFDMIKCFKNLFYSKKEELSLDKSKYLKGLSQLEKTHKDVLEMQETLRELQPVLEAKKKESELLAQKIELDTIEANNVRRVVEDEEREVNQKTQEIQRLQEEAEFDFQRVMPMLDSAIKAVESINPKDITEIRTFPSPPPLVVYTLEAIAIILEHKTDWDSIKRLLNSNFIDTLKNFNRDDIKPQVINKLRYKISSNPNFTPDRVGSQNQSSKSLCQWVFAIEHYAKVIKEVTPKRLKLEKMNKALEDALSGLRVARDKLRVELQKVEDLENTLREVINERDKLGEQIMTDMIRLTRASVLTDGLKEEQIRWGSLYETLNNRLSHLIGDTLMAAICVSYYGPFTGSFRNQLVSMWIKKCQSLQIPLSEEFDLANVLAYPLLIREWNIASLPSDSVSINNAILATRSERWPLMIDPQEQANRWIRQMEQQNNIKIAKDYESDFNRTLEACLRNGLPMLIEDVGESLNPSLDSIFHMNIVERTKNMFEIKFGDNYIDYDMKFRLYITTKISNPHYLPETFIKVNIINFTVTSEGLEEQLLAEIVRIEEPEIEKQKVSLIIDIAKDQKKLKQLEDSILNTLSETKGNILDDAKLINTLKSSKQLAQEINDRVKQSEVTKKLIEDARVKYKPVAIRGSVLYFVIADLAIIDPMYQYSLRYFSKLFNDIIEKSEKTEILEERLRIIIKNTTFIIYQSICKGLFNRHKLIFSFLIASKIARLSKNIEDAEWSLFLRGASIIPPEYGRPRRPEGISEKAWNFVICLQNISEKFKVLGKYVDQDILQWLEWINCGDPTTAPPPAPYSDLSIFHLLLLMKAFREEKIFTLVNRFVDENLGPEFLQASQISIEELFQDSRPKIPLIFILSSGGDPMNMIQKYAKIRSMNEKLDVISLGKGQGERAKRFIEHGIREGKWIVLQNCHLAKSWMPELERLVYIIGETNSQPHEDFRLFLTSMPCDYFPVAVLQNGTKVTSEQPKGLKSNMLRSISMIQEEKIEKSAKPEELRKFLMSLCFFHGVVKERLKFGSLGWNVSYEFNESDFDTSIEMITLFLEEESIPVDAIKYITGEIIYGGRVTDSIDRRTLNSILSSFVSVEVLEHDYAFSPSKLYKIPTVHNLDGFKQYVKTLPSEDDPEIFGMHPNANITYQIKESELIVLTVLSIQPKEKGRLGKPSDTIVDEIAKQILEILPRPLLISEAGPITFAKEKNGLMDALATFLMQEISRFNKLLSSIRASLEDLRKAIRGLALMSDELDLTYVSILNNQVPHLWQKVAYPSLKPLGIWVDDLVARTNFIRTWLKLGPPNAFWISCFFFPQGFLTAALQSYARKYHVPIDTLMFAYEFQQYTDPDYIEEKPEEGVYIYGLFAEGCRWDMEYMELQDSRPGEMFTKVPIILFVPVNNKSVETDDCPVPVYKTSARAGVLSTTGHSTNFVIFIDCPNSQKPSYWILKGAAFVCQLND